MALAGVGPAKGSRSAFPVSVSVCLPHPGSPLEAGAAYFVTVATSTGPFHGQSHQQIRTRKKGAGPGEREAEFVCLFVFKGRKKLPFL